MERRALLDLAQQVSGGAKGKGDLLAALLLEEGVQICSRASLRLAAAAMTGGSVARARGAPTPAATSSANNPTVAARRAREIAKLLIVLDPTSNCLFRAS